MRVSLSLLTIVILAIVVLMASGFHRKSPIVLGILAYILGLLTHEFGIAFLHAIGSGASAAK